MLFKNRKTSDIRENNVTPEKTYIDRRSFILGAGGLVGIAGIGATALPSKEKKRVLQPLSYKPDNNNKNLALTSYEAVTQYNNFYEFGVGKGDPSSNAWHLKPEPWTVQVTGLAAKTGVYSFDDLIKQEDLEERIYRLRCVEAWSMVIPWIGVPLRKIISRLEPQASAKFIAFETLADRKQMPGIKWPVLDWPYVEGLRLDEAMNDLTLMATGLYGKQIPNQNGAPMRLVVPWKYGFKSIKSIVRIHFSETQPPTSWNKSAPREYGFYSNVNPNVSHPRWSQARERRIGEFGRRDTLMFNGYTEEVASLYAGMNLAKSF